MPGALTAVSREALIKAAAPVSGNPKGIAEKQFQLYTTSIPPSAWPVVTLPVTKSSMCPDSSKRIFL